MQAAKFISSAKSKDLIGKLSGPTSHYEAESLQHCLYVEKGNDKVVKFRVDLLYAGESGISISPKT